MTENGCDMRSSHFYIANANVFRQVIEYLLDVSDEHRIIDWFVLHRFPNQIYADYPIAMQAALATYPSSSKRSMRSSSNVCVCTRVKIPFFASTKA